MRDFIKELKWELKFNRVYVALVVLGIIAAVALYFPLHAVAGRLHELSLQMGDRLNPGDNTLKYVQLLRVFTMAVRALFYGSMIYAGLARLIYLNSNRKKLNEINPVNERTSYLTSYVFHLLVLTVAMSLYMALGRGSSAGFWPYDTGRPWFVYILSMMPGTMLISGAYLAIVWMATTIGMRSMRFKAFGSVIGVAGAAMAVLIFAYARMSIVNAIWPGYNGYFEFGGFAQDFGFIANISNDVAGISTMGRIVESAIALAAIAFSLWAGIWSMRRINTAMRAQVLATMLPLLIVTFAVIVNIRININDYPDYTVAKFTGFSSTKEISELFEAEKYEAKVDDYHGDYTVYIPKNKLAEAIQSKYMFCTPTREFLESYSDNMEAMWQEDTFSYNVSGLSLDGLNLQSMGKSASISFEKTGLACMTVTYENGEMEKFYTTPTEQYLDISILVDGEMQTQRFSYSRDRLPNSPQWEANY